MQKNASLRKLVLASILVAMQIVLSRYIGVQSQFFQSSFGFVPIACASALLGPLWGSVVAFIADFIGVTIAGTGAYFPLFGVKEILYALIFAAFLYKRKPSAIKAALCVVVQTVFVAIPLTPLWLYIYFSMLGTTKAFSVIFMSKITASLIELPIKAAVLIPLSLFVFPKLEKIFIKRSH